MRAARRTHPFVHPLLDDRPLAVTRDDERVQVDLEAVGDRVVVDSRGEPARTHERLAIRAGAIGDATELVRRPA